MKLSTIVLLVFVFAGCTTSVKMGDRPANKIEIVDVKNYSLGEPATAYVGDPIVVRKSYKAVVKKDLYRANNDFVLEGGIGSVAIYLDGSAGNTYRIAGTNEKGNPALAIPNSTLMFGVNENSQWDQTVMSPSFWSSPVGSGSGYDLLPEDTTFSPVESTTPVSEAGYLNHELVFTGQGANGINLLYREYTFENMARSAYTQELVYPLDTDEIRFRNYQIDMVSVSSSEIKYIVNSD